MVAEPAWVARPIAGKVACLHCGTPSNELPLAAYLHPGFGTWEATCDRQPVMLQLPDNEGTQLGELENFAQLQPHRDWRVHIYGPLWGGTYQRHPSGQWLLIEQNEGFA